MNIIDWAATAKKVAATEEHEAISFGFDFVIEHNDGSWIGVVDPNDPNDPNAGYWVHTGAYDDYFERLTDAQVALWNMWVKPSHEDTV